MSSKAHNQLLLVSRLMFEGNLHVFIREFYMSYLVQHKL